MSLDINLTNVESTTNKKTTLTDNSDTFYPTQKAVKTAVDAKENTITAGTTAQYFRGDKTFQTLDKTAVGLSNVDNTSDANKPVSTATQTALNAKFNTPTGTTAQYLRGDGSLETFPTIPDASDFVAKSDFTSHSILAKQSGASDPVAVSIGNNEILGRKSGGGSNIEGLSVSEVKSLLNYTASDVGAVATNSVITGATKTKISYDAKGLVTSGADATTADIADSSNKRYVTDAQRDAIAVSGTIIVTSGTSFTTPSNITTATKFDIVLVGGGGGGAGTNSGTTTGGGGCSSGVCIISISGLNPSTSYVCAIGSAGAGGASNTAGSDGGNTTLTIGATTYTAEGGEGGKVSQTIVAGGNSINGTLNFIGNGGKPSAIGSTTFVYGAGADTPLGYGSGGLPVGNSSNGQNATNYGAGGSGARGLAVVGGNGSNGIIIAKYYS
jgi:hypothetical protein